MATDHLQDRLSPPVTPRQNVLSNVLPRSPAVVRPNAGLPPGANINRGSAEERPQAQDVQRLRAQADERWKAFQTRYQSRRAGSTSINKMLAARAAVGASQQVLPPIQHREAPGLGAAAQDNTTSGSTSRSADADVGGDREEAM